MAQNSQKSVLREYLEAIVTAIVLVVIIRTFIVQAFKIPSGSMLHTLEIGDYILVNKFIYWFTEPERGDVIVFKYPRDKSRDFIKRVVGLPGETLEIKDRVVYINGQRLEEPYVYHAEELNPEAEVFPRDNFGPLKIPEGYLFVMGDNRESSMDSRYWGPLDERLIRGKAFIIYWSVKPLKPNPEDNFLQIFWKHISTLWSRIRWERLGRLIR